VNWIRLELPALPENVALVRLAVAALAAQLDFTLPEIEEIRVATSEAFSNAVLHAYPEAAPEQAGASGQTGPGSPGATVTVEARLDGDTLEVSVADRGVGIADVALARAPAYTTLPDRMGLGFAFMESFMDEVDVRTSPGSGTRVVMRKRCAERPEAKSDSGVAGSAGGGEAGAGGRG
jgi:stage II sporulation protein AB (anti-sigma F factor)